MHKYAIVIQIYEQNTKLHKFTPKIDACITKGTDILR
jgi:hypothetical protein